MLHMIKSVEKDAAEKAAGRTFDVTHFKCMSVLEI